MKKIIILLLTLVPQALQAQNDLSSIRRKSYFTNIYQVSAKDALQFREWDSIPVQRFENAPVFKQCKSELLDEDSLPLGYYAFIRVDGSYLSAEIFCKTNLVLLTVNNKKRLQIDIRTTQGAPVENAMLYVGKKKANFNKNSHTFWVKQLAFEEKEVIVYAPGDTMITNVTSEDEIYPSIREQRRKNFKYRKVFRTLSWVPRKTKALFAKKKPGSRAATTGYMIFNKPKYKPMDTVRFKAYIIDKKKKHYNKTVNARFTYYARGGNDTVHIGKLKPVSPGAYTGYFVLGDSIPTGIRCWLQFTNNDQEILAKEVFSLEEYVLDEIGTQTFTSDKERYYKNDSLIFKASAKDANGLHVMDATARLILKTGKVDSFFKVRILIPDTLYNKEIRLKTTTDTRFVIPASVLPAADLTINAILIFKNANNELQEKELDIEYLYYSHELVVEQKEDSLLIKYIEDGVEKPAQGTMEMNDMPEEKISYPLSVKINPLAEDYTFYAETGTGYIDTYFEIEERYRVGFIRYSQKDTLGFMLSNPYKIPVYYTVLNADKVVATGSSNESLVVWKKLMNNRRQAYDVRWQYYWAGEEQGGRETIGLLYKLLNIDINGKDKIFPGETDSIKIKITDYKGKPAAGVNLTAVSYNNQFKAAARLKEPPHLVNYKFKNGIDRNPFERDEVEDCIVDARYPLGKHKKWINIFSLDSMEYYQLLFPADHYYDAVRYKKNALIPQLAVHAVDNGMPQQIFLLYINNKLAYYNGVTHPMAYSFFVWPQNVKLGIRLKDRYIEIDSLYIQPDFKHDISFDINNLPPHSREFKKDPWFNLQEMNTIENSMMQVKNSVQNNSWIWQEDRLVKIPKGTYGSAIVGPFASINNINYFRENEFDLQVAFEPGFEYTFSKQVSRLEKKPIFLNKQEKQFLKENEVTGLVLGDTIRDLPVISYPKPVSYKNPLLVNNDAYKLNASYAMANKGRLLLNYHRDSALKYIIVLNKSDTGGSILLPFANRMISNLDAGVYTILLVDKNEMVHTIPAVEIKEAMISCVRIPVLLFEKDNTVIKKLQAKADSFYMTKKQVERDIPLPPPVQKYMPYNAATAGPIAITGNVKDKKGKGVPFASVVIKGSGGVQTDMKGDYSIRVRAGDVLVFNAVGYTSAEVRISSENTSQQVNVSLEMNSNLYEEVVVTSAYATRRVSRSTSANVQVVSADELTATNMNYALAGKVPGITMNAISGTADTVKIWGIGLPGNTDLIYIIDGIIYTTPQNIAEDMIVDITVLPGPDAAAFYGTAAAAGAIVITTKRKISRKEFRDYGFWEPNFFTDKNGEAAIKVTYPDNITSWKTYVVGMDKKNRIGKSSILTQSYKPMLAQLNLPLFLIEGDSSRFITKCINYTPDTYSLKTLFKVNDQPAAGKQFELKGNDAVVNGEAVTASGDTVTASFAINSSTGFRDIEERKIPVFKKGMEQAKGIFNVLNKDTTIHFAAQPGDGELDIYAHNNTLDLLLSELDNLKKYPYYCVEQMTSKFRGLQMEKQIREVLKQPFKSQHEMDLLLSKIQKAQQFDGGWPWWTGGKANLYITNYITAALLPMRNDPSVAPNVRNGLLYLQGRLSYSNNDEMLSVLTTLSDAGHEMNYVAWLNKLKFDSLTQQQQWQWVKIMQQQKQDYKKQLKQLMDKKTETMLGGIHWGVNNYLWYSNEIATTVLAMEILKNEPGMESVVNAIIQYFLEMKRSGYWRNTVESASILNTVLPVLLHSQKNFTTEATIHIKGDTSFTINKFPYHAKMNTSGINNIDIQKQGGGMVYFTAYQTWFNTDPVPNNEHLVVQTRFERNGQEIQTIRSGEKIKMIVNVKTLKDADYVMITMPIPAGCIFTDKETSYFSSYKEYYKDKMMMYVERLPKGSYNFEATLEPRYNGSYQLNPAKAELMYYPVVSGNNEMKRMDIE